jgi:glutamate synthase domain-containing protein 2
MTVRQKFVALSIVLILLTWTLGAINPDFLWGYVIIFPVVLIGVIDMYQTQHTVRRLYPVIARLRYVLETIRPEIQQYFVESETNGKPAAREYRSLIYQRAKGDRDTRPFGTVFDVNQDGYEWINHSLSPLPIINHDPRIQFGGPDCTQPYDASPLNISAMSFGALSKNAIMALNLGAKLDGFAHNTGEGGLSEHHLKYGGDLIWQIGTGYFGCRNDKGQFDSVQFTEKARISNVKMIEIKLSQGAKPGHGGILPAAKVTPEIARIRLVPLGEDVVSPPAHTAFDSPKGLLKFVKELRLLSGGKPVGFKLCLGVKKEFMGICKAMLETGITPDFITVDGGEGGTGAAPAEMTNSVGTPLRDALIFVHNTLIGAGLRDKIKIIASGKIFTAFHMLRIIALGADSVNSARGMMFALGCLQSRSCNSDRCPTGIATQNPARYKALVVEDKSKRVARFHKEMILHVTELLAAAGVKSLDNLMPVHINRRVEGTIVKTYRDLYPTVETGCLLDDQKIPDEWREDWLLANASNW